jgi:LacI family transcriptional regulator
MTARRIAILVETSHGSAREKLRGILGFIRETGADWVLDHEPRRLETKPPEWLRNWRGDGIIARSHCPQTVAAIVRSGRPAVEILGVARHPSIPLVIGDDRAVAGLAAEHLRERGFRSFAFVGVLGKYWSDRRQRHFVASLEAAGHGCETFLFEKQSRLATPPLGRLKKLIAWVARLPRPVGIFAANDQYAVCVAAACREAGIGVPDDAAIVGADNDETFCELANPPISSVFVDHYRAGYEGAKLLSAMLDGTAPPRPGGNGSADWIAREVPPRGLVLRRSSDCLAVDDPEVAAALKVIRSEVGRRLTAADLAEHLQISRATLIRRFSAVVGHGVHDEILRVRIREAQRLLAETDLPIPAVAKRCGFEYQEHMSRVFRRRVGTSPAAYRKTIHPKRGR